MSKQRTSLGFIINMEGVNRVGKSEQVARLKDKLLSKSFKVLPMKFPRYELSPSGPRLNAYLREGNPEGMTALQFQELNVMNRIASQNEILEHVSLGGIVILEGWTDAGLAWGEAGGLSQEELHELKKISVGLLSPDLKILLDGEQFATGKEVGHKHEEDDEITMRAKRNFVRIAHADPGWAIVRANQTPEEVHEDVWEIVETYLPE